MTLTRVGRLGLTEGGIGQTAGILEYREFLATIDLASQATITAGNQDIAVTGLAIGDIPLFCQAPEGIIVGISLTTLGPVGVANTLRIRVTNPTAGAVDAASGSFVIGVLRPAA
jgi:hypothetical protein